MIHDSLFVGALSENAAKQNGIITAFTLKNPQLRRSWTLTVDQTICVWVHGELFNEAL